MANITLRDKYEAEKTSDGEYEIVKTLRPRQVFNAALPNLVVGHGMKITLEVDTGAGLEVAHTATYYPDIAPGAGRAVHPVITFDSVEMNAPEA